LNNHGLQISYEAFTQGFDLYQTKFLRKKVDNYQTNLPLKYKIVAYLTLILQVFTYEKAKNLYFLQTISKILPIHHRLENTTFDRSLSF